MIRFFTLHYILGIYTVHKGSRFLIFNFLQLAIDGKNNSKTKVEKEIKNVHDVTDVFDHVGTSGLKKE
jgi:hypothetical protein